MTISIKIDEAPFPKELVRQDYKIGRILNEIAKFAVESTVTGSLKGITGPKKLYKIVQERLKNPPTSIPLNNCKKTEEVKLAERMQIKIEEMLEDMGQLKLQNETSAKCIKGKEPLEREPNEGSKRSYVLKPEKERIFIRSRL